jgi:hypothetical protein
VRLMMHLVQLGLVRCLALPLDLRMEHNLVTACLPGAISSMTPSA